jgi:hypothetical protein
VGRVSKPGAMIRCVHQRHLASYLQASFGLIRVCVLSGSSTFVAVGISRFEVTLARAAGW